ncbi:MAG TPA: PQQ-binding-like beta-propeller repeat protein [Nitrospiraceae bacterium]|nr:PQQ-binding-like beta-propeller repeat protein [Nitrospiraceae bacterium]
MICTRRPQSRVSPLRKFLVLTLLVWAGVFLFNLSLGKRSAIANEAEWQGIVAAGFGVQTEGISSFLIRAYDAKTGDLLWQDQFPMAVIQEDEASTDDPDGGRVFAGGVGVSNGSIAHFPIRAYNLKTGAFLWEGQLKLVKRSGGTASVVATRGRQGSVAERTQDQSLPLASTHFLLRAYDNRTGELLWQDQFNPMENTDEARDDTNLIRAFPVRRSTGFGGQLDFLIRTFNPTTGQLLWQDRFTPLWRGDGASDDDTARTRRHL